MPISGNPLDDVVSLDKLLHAGLTLKPDEKAVVSLQQTWTFRELDEASDNLCAQYLDRGLKTGDRIASLMPNRGALLVHYIACFKAGLIAVPLNYRNTPIEIERALDASGARFMLFHAEREADILQATQSREMAGLLSFEWRGIGPYPTFEEWIERKGKAAAPANLPADTPVFMLFTSGSTGPAKGVTHSRESISYMFASCAAGFEMTVEDRVLPGSSLSHIGGILFSFSVLSLGGQAIVARAYGAEEIVPLMRVEKPTVLCMLPCALFNLLRDGHATREDFASLRLVRSGSDKVPIELETEFLDLTGIPIDEGYGCSEMGLATLNPPSARIVPGSAGRPVAGFDISIRDENGKEVSPGEPGVVWMRTKSRMLGYWNDPVATEKVFDGEWFDSGDIMHADEDGYLYFRGRKKQIIIHNSLNIFPQEVEDALLLHPSVAYAGVIGVHDLVHGENVRAYVVAKDGTSPSDIELIAFAQEQIGYKAPEEIRFLDEIPLNPTGKVDRVTLKRLAEEAHDHS
ncbi:class I adenylate-forming enzyme family protein [Roseibium sp. MMSF_3544]|uniref:class I adenylate-forming enzyme family protein n=1 Tax=unclassified Roseibium TaxID=2629323 RepID=UPI00273FC843|nr:class I adenylate-forming enzyme family protein [Roseibium sp. MMSF_3544]